MKKITVELANPYTCLIERGALRHAGTLAKKYVEEGNRAVIVTTAPIRKHCGAAVEASLRQEGVSFHVLEMRDGERYKNLSTVEDLAVRLTQLGADRGTVILALGGGVVGDVAGFLAAIYMRGISVLQLPTTLVAMIDSAIGGKTGVNLKTGKNLAGAFHHPRAVLIDPEALATLPEREYRSGLSEAIKYGIIRQPGLYQLFEQRGEEIRRREPSVLDPVIADCVRAKAEIVAADEKESDLRRILNFGHTFGHALEAATEYRHFLHGEAVAWGMIAACHLAVRLRRLRAETARTLTQTILKTARPLPSIPATASAVLAHTATDKKMRSGVLHFVLPRDIGTVEIVRNVPAAAALEAVREIIQLSQNSKQMNGQAEL